MSKRTLWGKSCGLDDRVCLQGLMSTSSLKTSPLLIVPSRQGFYVQLSMEVTPDVERFSQASSWSIPM